MEIIEANSMVLRFKLLKVKEETKENILKKEAKSQVMKV